MKNNKITLEEFWNSEEFLAIHCDTEEKAIKLLRTFDKMGKKWRSRNTYLEKICWKYEKENTCYDNINGYGYIDWFKKMVVKSMNLKMLILRN